MALYAIGDHLYFTGEDPLMLNGKIWQDRANRFIRMKNLTDKDTLVITGDHAYIKKPEELTRRILIISTGYPAKRC